MANINPMEILYKMTIDDKDVYGTYGNAKTYSQKNYEALLAGEAEEKKKIGFIENVKDEFKKRENLRGKIHILNKRSRVQDNNERTISKEEMDFINSNEQFKALSKIVYLLNSKKDNILYESERKEIYSIIQKIGQSREYKDDITRGQDYTEITNRAISCLNKCFFREDSLKYFSQDVPTKADALICKKLLDINQIYHCDAKRCENISEQMRTYKEFEKNEQKEDIRSVQPYPLDALDLRIVCDERYVNSFTMINEMNRSIGGLRQSIRSLNDPQLTADYEQNGKREEAQILQNYLRENGQISNSRELEQKIMMLKAQMEANLSKYMARVSQLIEKQSAELDERREADLRAKVAGEDESLHTIESIHRKGANAYQQKSSKGYAKRGVKEAGIDLFARVAKMAAKEKEVAAEFENATDIGDQLAQNELTLDKAQKETRGE